MNPPDEIEKTLNFGEPITQEKYENFHPLTKERFSVGDRMGYCLVQEIDLEQDSFKLKLDVINLKNLNEFLKNHTFVHYDGKEATYRKNLK